jgi:hypothetical protein
MIGHRGQQQRSRATEVASAQKKHTRFVLSCLQGVTRAHHGSTCRRRTIGGADGSSSFRLELVPAQIRGARAIGSAAGRVSVKHAFGCASLCEAAMTLAIPSADSNPQRDINSVSGWRDSDEHTQHTRALLHATLLRPAAVQV